MSTKLIIGSSKKYVKKAVATKKIDQEQDKEIKSLKRKVNEIEKSTEEHVRHVQVAQTTFDRAQPFVYCLNGLAQGTGVATRSGNLVKAKRIDVRIQLFANAPTLTFDTLVRVMLVREKTTLGSMLSITQFLGVGNPFTYACRNYQNRDQDRYKVIKDVVVGLGPVSTAINGTGISTFAHQGYPSIRDLHFDCPLNVNVNHSRSNLGTQADIENYGYFLLFFTDVDTVNAVSHRFDYNYHFTDA